MRQPVLAANWKMNHGPTEARAFMATFLASYAARSDRTIVICPPAVSLTAVRAALRDRPDVLVGVQNIHTEASGAFTGETSAPMARDAGASIALVGHSERRHVFGEADNATADKCALAMAHGLTPILCVGEKRGEREAGNTEDVVLRQLRAGLSQLNVNDIPRVIVAYEPVWAIGTGATATPADAAAVHRMLHGELGKLGAAEVPILYGGSVTATNARALLDAPGVDGLLVGGASLDPRTWTAIAST